MTPSPSPFQPGGRFKSIPGFSSVPRIIGIDPNASRITGGGSATITGFNFRLNRDGSDPLVEFGSLSATGITVVNARTITCTIPVATEVGTVDISVTADGQIGVAPRVFTYFDTFIRKVLPPFGPVAGGTTVIIEGENFLSSVTVTFDGVAATAITVIDSQHISCVTPARADGVGFVDVVVV